MGWVTSFLCVSIHLALAVVDLNVQEIQYVADHLTDKKCDQLMEALGEKTFMIHPERFTTPKPVQGHPEAPCVRRIRAWSKDQGKNMTFEFLALRLREIGLEKEADKLSRTVLGETVQELHRYFLDDPFKVMIPTKSFMVDKDDLTTKTKEVIIPERSKEKTPKAPLEFIRNIWGSSAGAGSGDFHVYRGVRRREYARQKFIKEMAEKEELDEAYKKRLEQHKLEAEERTAKKRAKRLKKKQKNKAKKMKKTDNKKPDGDDGSDTSDDDNEDSNKDDDESHADPTSDDGSTPAPDQPGC